MTGTSAVAVEEQLDFDLVIILFQLLVLVQHEQLVLIGISICLGKRFNQRRVQQSCLVERHWLSSDCDSLK